MAGTRHVTADDPAGFRPRTITVAATGDIMVDSPIKAAGAEFRGGRHDLRLGPPLLAPVTPYLERADLAICHMEFPIGAFGEFAGPYGQDGSSGYRWLAPYETADSIASRVQPLQHHEQPCQRPRRCRAGFHLGGTRRSRAEPCRHGARRGRGAGRYVRGQRGSRRPSGLHQDEQRHRPGRLPADGSDEDDIVADVDRGTSTGAEIVIVSLHLGREMLSEPLGNGTGSSSNASRPGRTSTWCCTTDRT